MGTERGCNGCLLFQPAKRHDGHVVAAPAWGNLAYMGDKSLHGFGRVLANWTIQSLKNLNNRLGFLGAAGGALTLEESVGHAENEIPGGERVRSNLPVTAQR